MIYIAKDISKNALVHYGTKNMKWGVRRFQNEDGTLTEEGRKRYANMMPTSAQRDYVNEYNKNLNKKIQYLNDNGYKTVSGKDLKGASKLKTNINEYTVFNTGNNVSWQAEKSRRGFDSYEEDDSYPIFENIQQAQEYAHILDSLPKGSYERAIYETDPNLMRALRNTVASNDVLARYAMPTSAQKAKKKTEKYEEIRKKNAKNAAKYEGQIPTSARLGMQGKNVIQKVKAGKGSMPTSAITAQQRAKNESILKSSIPASAWNSKTSYINRETKTKASGLSTFMKKSLGR